MTPAPAPVLARAVDYAALRAAPNQNADILAYVPVASVAPVIGCSAGCSWLLLQLQSGATAWSARYFWSVTGDLSRFGGR